MSDSLVRYSDPIEAGVAKERKAKAKAGKAPTGEEGAGLASDVLGSLIPPREFKDGGQSWVQFVSEAPATRTEVVALQKELDKRLVERKAREIGICPVRQELYAQCFGEFLFADTTHPTQPAPRQMRSFGR